MMNDASERQPALTALLVFVLLATIVGGVIDIYLDAPDTWRSPHVLYEVALIVAAMATSVLLWHGWWRSRMELSATRRVLAEQVAERETWRASAVTALSSFSRAIDERFDRWGLTATEREIALMLLKGRSHKQIAYETDRSERTVRQHAVAVYQKSGLSGRAELAAFFLDDLMLPRAHS